MADVTSKLASGRGKFVLVGRTSRGVSGEKICGMTKMHDTQSVVSIGLPTPVTQQTPLLMEMDCDDTVCFVVPLGQCKDYEKNTKIGVIKYFIFFSARQRCCGGVSKQSYCLCEKQKNTI